MNKKFIIIILIAVALVAAGFVWKNQKQAMIQKQQITKVSPTVTPIPTSTKVAGWQQYTNAKYSYNISYPQGMVLSLDSNSNFKSIHINKKNEDLIHNFSMFYISVIPSGDKNKDSSIYNYTPQELRDTIYRTQIGTIVKDMPYLRRLQNEIIDSVSGLAIENTRQWETKAIEKRVYLDQQNTTYVIGFYYNNDDEFATYQKILSTFSFIK